MSNTKGPSDEAVHHQKSSPLPFGHTATGGFSAEVAIRELLTPSYRGRRDVILAGIAAYSVQPEIKFARRAMRIRCIDLYLRHCEAIALGTAQSGIEGDPIKRSGWSVEDLRRFKSIYEKLGGSKILNEVSKPEFMGELRGLRDQLAQAHTVMAIWHILILNNRFGQRYRLNVQLGCELASDIGYLNSLGKRERASSRTFERAWERFHRTISLSYAALNLDIPGQGSVLDVILDWKLTAELIPLLPTWFGRARFVHDNILSTLVPGKLPRRFLDFSKLPIDAMEIPGPVLHRAAMVTIEAAYS